MRAWPPRLLAVFSRGARSTHTPEHCLCHVPVCDCLEQPTRDEGRVCFESHPHCHPARGIAADFSLRAIVVASTAPHSQRLGTQTRAMRHVHVAQTSLPAASEAGGVAQTSGGPAASHINARTLAVCAVRMLAMLASWRELDCRDAQGRVRRPPRRWRMQRAPVM